MALASKYLRQCLPKGEIAYVRSDKSVQGVFYTNGQRGPVGPDLNSLSWSPDGKNLVYSRYINERISPEPKKLWSRNPKYELFITTWLPACDPTGQRFAVTHTGSSSQGSNLFIVEQGKPARSILDRKELILAPQWSADGRRIIFGIGSFPLFVPSAEKNGQQVGIVNADGSGFHIVTSGQNDKAFPSFAPDGQHIVYRTNGSNGESLRIMNLEDHSVSVLTKDWDNFPVWSPRGDLIAFVRKIGDDFEIFTIRPDGKDMTQLTHTKGNDAHVSWSPDGERLVFTSSRMGFKDEALLTDGAPQPYGEIFVMRYDGTQVEQLTDNQWEDGGPAWMPNKPNLPTTAFPPK